jgi:predicted nucleotidyltransferase
MSPSDLPETRDEPERVDVGEETFLRVLDEAVAALSGAGVDYAVMGGVASATFGRPRWTLDVDLFVRPQDAERALATLEGAGFERKPSPHNWLLKAVKERVLVDVIFVAKGGIYLDDQMLERARPVEFKGLQLRMVPPEDLVVMKAIAADQDTPRYWHDALGIIAATDLDWDYLLRRARSGPRRVLSLLLHAQADDLIVPDRVVRELHQSIFDPKPQAGRARTPLAVHGSEEHMVAHVREALAEDPRCNELNIEATIHGDTVVLRGRVPTRERRDAAGAIAGELLPGYKVDNRVAVVKLTEDARAETVA